MNRPVTQFLACLGFVRLAGVLAGLHLSAANEAVDSTETRITAYSMLTHDGRRMVSHLEGTNTVYELVPTRRQDVGCAMDGRIKGCSPRPLDLSRRFAAGETL